MVSKSCGVWTVDLCIGDISSAQWPGIILEAVRYYRLGNCVSRLHLLGDYRNYWGKDLDENEGKESISV